MPDGRFDVTVVRDQPYDVRDGLPLLADLYLPRDAPAPPVVIWVHGGGWRYGSRKLAPDLSRFFAARGFAMVAIDYRLSDRALFPAQLTDVRTAIRWLRSAAATYGLDGDRLGLWGASSGGHLSALAALCAGSPFGFDRDRYPGIADDVQAVVSGYAPIDFLQLDEDRPDPAGVPLDPENLSLAPGMRSADANSFESLLLGAPIHTCAERAREANPLTYVRPGAPPFLILHGTSDTTVGAHQSELLYQALAAAGDEVAICLIEKLGHGFLNRSHLDEGPPWRMTLRSRVGGSEGVESVERPVFPLIESFFGSHLVGGGGAGRKLID